MWFKIWDRRERAVRRGIKLLDQQVPDWWQHINSRSLQMSDPYYCVLGQLATSLGWDRGSYSPYGYSPYGTGAERLGLLNCRRHGFDTLEFASSPEYIWLTERWGSEIEKRQLAGANN